MLSLVHFYFEVTKNFRNFSEEEIFRKMYQGGSSRKKGPRLAIRELDDKPPREADVRPCEWPSEQFMVAAGIKDEFYAYIQNAELTNFLSDKSP